MYGMRHNQTILSKLSTRHEIRTVEKYGSFMNLEASTMQNKTTVYFMVVMNTFSYDSHSRQVSFFSTVFCVIS